ncbi:MAG: dihydrolipoamide acetyltransferase family protein [Acidimicrobiales bacterium]|jgi:pyruvate dehydrogenase E2 component (dihydrolipoamide acetyltransferase)
MGDFHMPSLGADMEVGRVTEWLVKVGDEVKRGDIVAVVETEKSTIEVEIFESGVIESIVVPVGEEVPVGAVLARVRSGAPGSSEDRGIVPVATEPTPPAEREPAARVSAVRSPVVRHLAAQSGLDLNAIIGTGKGGVVTRHDVEQAVAARQPPTGRVRASPWARRVAAELGVDLNSVQGTGPRGAVTEADVQDVIAARSRVSASPDERVVTTVVPEAPAATGPTSDAASKQATLRRAIGALMARSKREIPHYYISTTIDMRTASGWLEGVNAGRSITDRIVMPVLLLKATARAVATVPEMNGFMVDGQFEASAAVHVGVAISLRGGGVIAPAIHDTAALGLDELMVALRDLVTRARVGRLRSSEMSDPTITVTNLGDLGVDQVFGVIYPPQVALVGFGKVAERPWAEGGLLGARPTVTATLAADHRVSDGHRGGLFLSIIDHLLQAPEDL